MDFTDAVALSGTRRTRDGYLVADARVARTGIQTYLGSEMGRPQMQIVRVFRPESEVFAADSMSSHAFRPVTNDHPRGLVDAKNWKAVSVGITGDTIARDGEFVRMPFTLMDASAIADVDAGKRELSLGYTAEIDWTPGTTEGGEHYDAVQRNIRGNHLAVVDAARAGHSCRIGDSWSTPPTAQKDPPGMPDNLRTVQVDGISISVTDQGAEAIAKLQRQLADAGASHVTVIAAKDGEIAALRDTSARALAAKDGEIAGLTANHAKALEAKDGEIAGLKAAHTSAIAAKDGEIAGLKAQVPDAATMDAMIADRARVFDAARKILGDKADFTGKTADEVRRMAVTHRLGDAQVSGKSDDYVGAAFDTLTAVAAGTAPGASADPVRDALRLGGANPATNVSDRDAPYLAYVQGLQDAWKTEKGAAA